MEELLTALGLAAPAGLNAPLVLLMVGLADRFGAFELGGDYSTLADTPVLAGLGVWLAAEEVLDKIVGADHANDVVQTFLRPAAGGLLALAATTGTEVPPELAVVLGIVSAGGIHAAKAGARPAVSVTTLGFGNPVVSVIEDVVAIAAVVAALIGPLAALAGFLLLVAFAAWGLRRLGRRKPG